MKIQAQHLLAVAFLLLGTSSAFGQPGKGSFHLNVDSVRGALTGEVSLTGAGAYDPASGFVKAGGSFKVLSDINQGPLSGLRAGEGSHWSAVQLLPSTGFKCTGVSGEDPKTAVSDDNTVVLLASFFRHGDGARPSFKARIFVSADDEAGDLPGSQRVWVQGVGCGDGIVDFGRGEGGGPTSLLLAR